MGVKQPSSRFNKTNTRQIEGRNPVREALRAGNPITKLIIEEKMQFDEKVSEIYTLAQEQHIPIERFPSKKMLKMSKTKGHHQGVIAYGEALEEPSVRQLLNQIRKEGREPFFVILAGVLYEHNLGAVLRTAEAAGVDAVIVPNRAMDATPVVCRTAMGAEEYIPLIHENLFTILKLFKEEGIKILGAWEEGSTSIFRTDLTRGVALISGVEDTGISESLAKFIDVYINIPMLGKIESLNMSVATAVCLYEVVRQRRYSK